MNAGCPTGNVTLTTQAEVDAFKSNYPGCKQFYYDLTISGPDITNLNGLDSLTFISYLYVNNTTSLVNLSGLSSLSYVGQLSVNTNTGLLNFTGLNNLDTIGSLYVNGNSSLINFTGLESLRCIPGLEMWILNNPSLLNLNGLENLETVGRILIQNNNSLNDIGDFVGLDTMWHIDISNNPSLLNVDGFVNLKCIEGQLLVALNSNLITINGFQSLNYIGALLSLGDNPNLVSANGFSSLDSVGIFIEIYRNNRLINLSDFSSLKKVGTEFQIVQNNSLIDFSGLSNIEHINILYIYDNPTLQTLDGLNPDVVVRGITIDNNAVLSCCILAKRIIENNNLNVGSTNIRLNDVGCNSYSEVMALSSTSSCCISSQTAVSKTICQGESWAVGTNTYTVTGTYYDTIAIFSNCDSIITTNLTVLPTYNLIQNRTFCTGQSFTLNDGRVITSNGTYFDTLQTTAGCDSIIEYRVSFLNNITSNQNASVCAGKSHTLPGGTQVDQPGTYRDTLSYAFGCDSIVITNLTVDPYLQSSQSISICRGATYTLPGGIVVAAAGTYRDTIQNANGCDSIVITNLIIEPYLQSSQSVSICSGANFTLPGGATVSAAGTYSDTIQNANGCDSIVITNLSIEPYLQSSQSVSICSGANFALPGGATVAAAGTYRDTIQNPNGCDSIVITTLSLQPYLAGEKFDTVCQGEIYITPGGQQAFTSGDYLDTLQTPAGCDSILTTHLTVKPNNFLASLEPADTIYKGQSIYLVPEYQNGIAVSWSWTPGVSLSCNDCETPVASPLQTTSYTLTVLSQDRCTDTALTNIVVETPDIYVPGAFSPNGDGVNDLFGVFAIGVQSVKISVFNRWGQLVFETAESNRAWDGRYKDDFAPVDDYTYMITGVLPDGTTMTKKGTILLLR